MNKCFFVGNVATAPELRGDNKNILVFRIAVNSRAYNAESQAWENTADFFDMVMFGKRAAAIGEFLTKGMQVTVEAHAQQNTWTAEDGSNRSKVQFVIDNLSCPPKK